MNRDRNDPHADQPIRAPERAVDLGDARSIPPHEEGDLYARSPWLHRWTHAPEIWRSDEEHAPSSEHGVPGGYGQGGAGPLGPKGMRTDEHRLPTEFLRGPSELGAAARAGARPLAGRRGGMKGISPKGYRRPDARIYEDLCDALTAHDGIDPSRVEVRVASGLVTLTGAVEDRAMKHLVEEVAEAIAGVRELSMQLKVLPSPSGASTTRREHDA